ncbi:copper chaperone PCu(A)C [Jatrophihabitans sp.]|uniref:copper chaperone PCu(A)C n=1 Tax=Jatrophihabitans sp. TaxID=1932789 RepID=UPI0038CD7193
MKRFPLSLIAAILLTVTGLAGLARGTEPTATAADAAASQGSQGPIVVSGAYVREPANGINAAAYFTLSNTTDAAESLTAVTSGAGALTTLHTDSMRQSAALTIPARGSVTLSPGKGHVMIEKLYGPLKAGQSVNFQLTFAKSGQLLLTAPVIAVTAPAPTAQAPR